MTFLLRRTDFHGDTVLGRSRLKLYTINADGQAASEGLLRAACEVATSVLPDQDGCGFLIVHRGEDATWLLVHWWQGDILCQRLLCASAGTEFVPAQPHLFACVWELHVIDHERRSWAINGLGSSPGGTRRYLTDAITVAAGAALTAPSDR